MKQNQNFRHESLQTTDSIKDFLKALTNGIAKGKVVLEDDTGTMTLEPEGLLNFKLSAKQDDDRNAITLKISWQGEQALCEKSTLKISNK
jgi:amphi-Trp domain-containing protein